MCLFSIARWPAVQVACVKAGDGNLLAARVHAVVASHVDFRNWPSKPPTSQKPPRSTVPVVQLMRCPVEVSRIKLAIGSPPGLRRRSHLLQHVPVTCPQVGPLVRDDDAGVEVCRNALVTLEAFVSALY